MTKHFFKGQLIKIILNRLCRVIKWQFLKFGPMNQSGNASDFQKRDPIPDIFVNAMPAYICLWLSHSNLPHTQQSPSSRPNPLPSLTHSFLPNNNAPSVSSRINGVASRNGTASFLMLTWARPEISLNERHADSKRNASNSGGIGSASLTGAASAFTIFGERCQIVKGLFHLLA